MKHYKISCVSISIITVLFVERERREASAHRDKTLSIRLADSIVLLMNCFHFLLEM